MSGPKFAFDKSAGESCDLRFIRNATPEKPSREKEFRESSSPIPPGVATLCGPIAGRIYRSAIDRSLHARLLYERLYAIVKTVPQSPQCVLLYSFCGIGTRAEFKWANELGALTPSSSVLSRESRRLTIVAFFSRTTRSLPESRCFDLRGEFCFYKERKDKSFYTRIKLKCSSDHEIQLCNFSQPTFVVIYLVKFTM